MVVRLLVVHAPSVGERLQQSSSSGHGLSVVHAGGSARFNSRIGPSGGSGGSFGGQVVGAF